MTGLSRTGHPPRRRPPLRPFHFGGFDQLQLALTVVGALLFLSAIVIAVGPIDPISPPPAADTDDDRMATENDTGPDSVTDDSASNETSNPANESSSDVTSDTGSVDTGGGGSDENGTATVGDTDGDESEQVPTFEQLERERTSLEREHKQLGEEHKRLKRDQATEEEWEQHQEEYEEHRERFRAHRADFEAYVEKFGSDKEAVKHRQWLEKVGAKHTIHDIRSERD